MKKVRRIQPKPEPKRTAVLFTRIKPVNKRFLEKAAKKVKMNLSEYVDAMVEGHRNQK